MNEKIKEYKIDNIVMGILSAVVGVILVIFPGTTLRMIGYLVSAALLRWVYVPFLKSKLLFHFCRLY